MNLKARSLVVKEGVEDIKLYNDILSFVYKGIDLRFFKLLIKYLKKVNKKKETFEKLSNLRMVNEGTDVHYFKKAWYLMTITLNKDEEVLLENFEEYFSKYIYDPYFIKKGVRNIAGLEGKLKLKRRVLSAYIKTSIMSGKYLNSQWFNFVDIKDGIEDTIGENSVV